MAQNKAFSRKRLLNVAELSEYLGLSPQTIYNQPEATMNFDAIVDSTGALCGHDAKLVAKGMTRKTPFPTLDPLWEVQWLSNEGTRIQAFYFDDEGTLEQADWGGTAARLVQTEDDARPADSKSAEAS